MTQPNWPDQPQNPQGQPPYQGQPSQPPYQGQPLPPQAYQVPIEGMPQAIQPEQSLGGKITKALLIGIAAVVIGALVWGGLAYLTERIFAYVAVVIGFGVSYALTSPFKRPLAVPVILTLIVPAFAFTIISVLLGDFFFVVLSFAKEFNIGIGEAFKAIQPGYFDAMREAGLGETLKSVIFALIGAGYGFYNAVKR